MVMVPLVPLSCKLYAATAVFNVLAVSAPLNAIVPAVAVRVVVESVTAPVKVVPPELVTVKVPMLVPIAPTETTPVVLIVIFCAVPVEPVIDVMVSALRAPVPIVKLAPEDKVVAPRVMAPVAVPPSKVVAVTLTVLLKLITLAPVLAAIVPAKVTLLGAVAVKPPL